MFHWNFQQTPMVAAPFWESSKFAWMIHVWRHVCSGCWTHLTKDARFQYRPQTVRTNVKLLHRRWREPNKGWALAKSRCQVVEQRSRHVTELILWLSSHVEQDGGGDTVRYKVHDSQGPVEPCHFREIIEGQAAKYHTCAQHAHTNELNAFNVNLFDQHLPLPLPFASPSVRHASDLRNLKQIVVRCIGRKSVTFHKKAVPLHLSFCSW